MSLSNEQVFMIEADVRSAAIKISTLHRELVDHICCEVEALMEEGRGFSEAYVEVKQHVNIGVLQTIEKNTMLLIDKNYARMKMFMKISGNVSLVFIAAGTLMKIYAALGANIILVLGFAILCLAFIPSLLYTYRIDPVKEKNLLFKISALIGNMAFACGILFRAMNWNGANILIALAYAIILAVSLPALIFNIQSGLHDKIDKRIYTFGVFSLMVFVLSTMFKMFHLPAAGILMLIGSVLLVSVSLPVITYREFKKSQGITGRYIFLIILSIYIVTMSLLMSYQAAPVVQNIISIR